MKKLTVYIFLSFLISVLMGPGASHSTTRGIRTINVLSKEGKKIELYKDYHALVIGVGNYEKWPKLPNAVNDAKEVGAKLTEMGFEVRLVLDPTAREMKTVMSEMVYEMGREENRALIFYYAGHGETETLADKTKMGYIIPRDCPLLGKDPKGFTTHAISMRDIESASLRIRSKHLLMLFDSCFSGSLFALVRAVPHDITEKSALPVRQYITAGREDEQVPDKSMFKRCFLIGLDGDADLTGDGYITGSELGMYLSDKVVNYTHRQQHPQYGKINNPNLDRGDFIFVPKKLLQKEKAIEKKQEEERSAIAEELEKLQEERRQSTELVKQLKHLLETKLASEEKEREALVKEKDLEEKLKQVEKDKEIDRELKEARIKELEAGRKAADEKARKETAEKKALEEELKRLRAEEKVRGEVAKKKDQEEALEVILAAKTKQKTRLLELDAQRHSAEEKARREAAEKKALEEELKRLKAEMKKTSPRIEGVQDKQTGDKRLVYIPKAPRRVYDKLKHGQGPFVIDDFEDKDLWSINFETKWAKLATGQASVDISADPTQGANGTSCSLKIEYEIPTQSVAFTGIGDRTPPRLREVEKDRSTAYDFSRFKKIVFYLKGKRKKTFFTRPNRVFVSFAFYGEGIKSMRGNWADYYTETEIIPDQEWKKIEIPFDDLVPSARTLKYVSNYPSKPNLKNGLVIFFMFSSFPAHGGMTGSNTVWIDEITLE